MIEFICYPKCTTCQKAKKWLDDNRIEYELRDIKEDNPTLEELTAWYKMRDFRSRNSLTLPGFCISRWNLRTSFLQ